MRGRQWARLGRARTLEARRRLHAVAPERTRHRQVRRKARARPQHERPGQLYVGYLAPMLDQQHCMAPLAAALLAGPQAVFDGDSDPDDLLDA